MSVRQRKTRGPGLPPEATLFHQAQKGNRLALNQLMVRHDGLVHAVIRRHGSESLSYAETLQAGRIGLWRAILKFDPRRGLAFSTYAWTCIMRHIWEAVKTEQSDVPTRPSGTWRLGAPTTDPALWLESPAVPQAVHDLVQRLAPRLQQTILAHYGFAEKDPATFVQIGRILGLSAERARQLHQEALIWLRQPAHSQMLRSLLRRHTLADYQALEKLSYCWWRSDRGRHAH